MTPNGRQHLQAVKVERKCMSSPSCALEEVSANSTSYQLEPVCRSSACTTFNRRATNLANASPPFMLCGPSHFQLCLLYM